MIIIVDTNIVFSAILNSDSKIAKILLYSKKYFQFYSCTYLQAEILKHRKKISNLTKLTDAELSELENIVTKNITFIDERLIPQKLLLQANSLLQDIDVNDTPFIALAKFLKGKLWTGDKQLYNGLKLKGVKNIVSSSELSNLLDELEATI